MAIVEENSSITRVGGRSWRVYAESDSVSKPVFYIWYDGVIVGRYDGRPLDGGGWYIDEIFTVEEEGTTEISVFDSASDIPDDIWPGRMIIQWEREADAAEYWLEEYVDSSWVVRKVVREAGQWMYWAQTRFLEDCEWHTFRIRVKSTNGTMSVARTMTLECVRRPDRPDATYSYDDETRVLTVTVS